MITYTSSAECITFSNGSRILSLPNSPESVRGYSCSGILALDEAAFIEHIDDLYQAIIPTMTRFPSSELIVSSTPGGC